MTKCIYRNAIVKFNLEKKTEFISHCLHKKKAEEIEVLIGDNSTFAEVIVICTVSSNVHGRAVVDFLEQELKRNKIKMYREGAFASGWIILDLHDLIIHVMEKSKRDFYNLEELHGKVRKVYHY